VLIPLKDENPLRWIGFPFVTVALIAACVLAYFWQLSLGPAQERMIYPKFSSWLVATWAGSGALQSQIVVSSGR
jgi:membrane associated rhomboid family serine protease